MENRHVVITFENEQLRAAFEDNATSRDFMERLPMTITMRDLQTLEKFTQVSGLTVDDINIPHFSKGDISYWTPGKAFVFYYRGNQEPLHGLVKMGEILEGVEILEKYSGNIEVTIDLA